MNKSGFNAGTLNKRITLQEQKEDTTDDAGYLQNNWVEMRMVWGKIITLSGNEFFKAQAINSRATYKIIIRYLKNVTTNTRILCNGQYYNIVHINNVDGQSAFLELLCEVIS